MGKKKGKSMGASQAAALMGASGFIGFGSPGGGAAGGVFGSELSSLNQEYVVAFKKTQKKDPATRLKGLQELDTLFAGADDTDALTTMSHWAQAYNRLSMDNDRRVREQLNITMRRVVSVLGKNLANILKTVIAAWMRGMADDSRDVAVAARTAFHEAFPEAKRPGVLVFCKATLFSNIEESLDETPETLSDLARCTKEEAQERYVRVISGTLGVLSHLLRSLSSKELEKSFDDLQRILTPAFWKGALSTKRPPPMRRAGYLLLKTAVLHVPVHVVNILADLAPLVLGLFGEADSTTHAAMWEGMLAFCQEMPGAWEHVNVRKAILPRFWSFLRKGCYGSASLSYSCLLPYLGCVPASVLGTDAGFADAFFEAVWRGYEAEDMRDDQDRNALACAYLECLVYISSRVEGAIPSVLETHLPVISRHILHPETAPFVVVDVLPAFAKTVLGLMQRQSDQFDERFWKSFTEDLRTLVDSLETNDKALGIVSGLFASLATLSEGKSVAQLKSFKSTCHEVARKTALQVDRCESSLEDDEHNTVPSLRLLRDVIASMRPDVLCDNEHTLYEVLTSRVLPWLTAAASRGEMAAFTDVFAMCQGFLADEGLAAKDRAAAWGRIVEQVAHHLDTCPAALLHVLKAIQTEAEMWRHPALDAAFQSAWRLVRSGRQSDELIDVVELCAAPLLAIFPQDTINAFMQELVATIGDTAMKASCASSMAPEQNLLSPLLRIAAKSLSSMPAGPQHAWRPELVLAVFRARAVCPSAAEQAWNSWACQPACSTCTRVGGEAINLSLELLEDDAVLLECDIIASQLREALRVVAVEGGQHAGDLEIPRVLERALSCTPPVVRRPAPFGALKAQGLWPSFDDVQHTADMGELLERQTCRALAVASTLMRDVGVPSIMSTVGATPILALLQWRVALRCHVATSGALAHTSEALVALDYLYSDTVRPFLSQDPTGVASFIQTIVREAFKASLSNGFLHAQALRSLLADADSEGSVLLSALFASSDGPIPALRAEDASGGTCPFLTDDAAMHTIVAVLPSLVAHDIVRCASELVDPLVCQLEHANWGSDDCGLGRLCHVLAQAFEGSDEALRSHATRSLKALARARPSFSSTNPASLRCALAVARLVGQLMGFVRSAVVEEEHEFLFSTCKELLQMCTTDISALLGEVASESLFITCKLVAKFSSVMVTAIAEGRDEMIDSWGTFQTVALASLVPVVVSCAQLTVFPSVIEDALTVLRHAARGVLVPASVASPSSLALLLPSMAAPCAAVQGSAHMLASAAVVANNVRVASEAPESDVEDKATLVSRATSAIAKTVVSENGVNVPPDSLVCGDLWRLVCVDGGAGPSENDVHGIYRHLLAWSLLLDHFLDASDDQRSLLSAFLAKSGLVDGLVASLVVSHLSSPHDVMFDLDAGVLDTNDPRAIPSFAAHIFTRLLLFLPQVVRDWWTSTDRSASAAIQKYVTRHVSPLLVSREIEATNAAAELSNSGDIDGMNVKGSVVGRTVTAEYVHGEILLSLTLRFPPAYPLQNVEVDCGAHQGVGEAQLRRWVLSLTTMLSNKDASLPHLLLMWKRSVDQRFEGIEDCPICYSVLHVTNHSLPKMACRTCKNKFHSACLYKWFTSSQQSTCPLCRTPF